MHQGPIDVREAQEPEPAGRHVGWLVLLLSSLLQLKLDPKPGSTRDVGRAAELRLLGLFARPGLVSEILDHTICLTVDLEAAAAQKHYILTRKVHTLTEQLMCH
jgi:hypothetical protein